MKTEDFDYILPEELIAQTPLKKRDESKLLILDKETGDINHSKFSHIIDYLDNNDVLVLNDTKVIPARIIGIKEETNAVIELLMLKEKMEDTWECLTKPAKRIKVGINSLKSVSQSIIKLEERKKITIYLCCCCFDATSLSIVFDLDSF